MATTDLGLTVTLPEGNKYSGTYTLRLGECTGLDDLDCLAKTQMTVFGLFDSVINRTGMGAIVAATIVWLVRRRQFPHLLFEDVCQAVPWSSNFTIADADDQTPKTFEELEEAAGKESGSEDEPPKPASPRRSRTSTASDRGNLTD